MIITIKLCQLSDEIATAAVATTCCTGWRCCIIISAKRCDNNLAMCLVYRVTVNLEISARRLSCHLNNTVEIW